MVRRKMEGCSNAPDYSVEEQLEHLKNINEAVGFESFLHTKFVGQKRFSLEGLRRLFPHWTPLLRRGNAWSGRSLLSVWPIVDD